MASPGLKLNNFRGGGFGVPSARTNLGPLIAGPNPVGPPPVAREPIVPEDTFTPMFNFFIGTETDEELKQSSANQFF